MADEPEKEEIIELTQVVEDLPSGPPSRGGIPEISPDPAPQAGQARPPSPDYGTEVRKLLEMLQAKSEEWTATEGVRIMERIARELFPPIAEKVLRQEIEKMKAEARAEEKE